MTPPPWDDLYAPDFPHGTQQGYDRGCRGSQCPAYLEGGLACRGVAMRMSGDYAFRKAIEGGMSPLEFVAQERAAAPAPKPTAQPAAPKPTPLPKPEPEPQEATMAPRTTATKDPTHPDFPHGTNAGYQRGCKDDATCPSDPTCLEAKRRYQRQQNAKKKTTSAGPGATAPAEVHNSSEEDGVAAPPEDIPGDDRGTSSLELPAEVLERGRQLASEREDLIAVGADPTQLEIPLAPDTPPEATALLPVDAGDGYPFTDVVAELEAKATAMEQAAARARAAVNALKGE